MGGIRNVWYDFLPPRCDATPFQSDMMTAVGVNDELARHFTQRLCGTSHWAFKGFNNSAAAVQGAENQDRWLDVTVVVFLLPPFPLAALSYRKEIAQVSFELRCLKESRQPPRHLCGAW